MKQLSASAIYLLGFIIIVCLLTAAYYLQYQKGVNPCPLCILQRFVMVILAIFFILGAMFGANLWARRSFAFLGLLTSIGGIVLSSRQVWMQHTPGPVANCSASLEYMLQALPLNQVISNIFKGSAECTQVGWTFLYLSLAEWSLLFFSFFALLSLWQLIRRSYSEI